MTDERMTQGDVRLREGEREALVEALSDDHPDWPADMAASEYEAPYLVQALAPVVERIVAARVGEVVERVEAACRKAEILTQESMGHVSEHWRGRDYADGLDAGIEVTADLVRDALRAADAPLSDQGRGGGRGDRAEESIRRGLQQIHEARRRDDFLEDGE